MRARSARRYRPTAAAAALGLVLLGTSFLVVVSNGVAAVDGRTRTELRRLREAAARAPDPERQQRWFELARFAIRSLSQPSGGEDLREFEKALEDATSRLTGAELAALAAHGRHPLLSQASCRAMLRGAGPKGIPPAAEAAAEARDAVAAFSGEGVKPLLDVLKRGERPAPGAGATQRSVYSLLVFSDSPIDSSATSILSGLEAGLREGAGALADRFVVSSRMTVGQTTQLGSRVASQLSGETAGLVVALGSDDLWTATSAFATERGILAVDARSPGEAGMELRTVAQAHGLESDLSLTTSFGPDLSYGSLHIAGQVPLVGHFQLRPTIMEQARRLAEALAERPDIKKIAIAIPSHGGNGRLAEVFRQAVSTLGRETVNVEYEPGRRDYAPELGQFVTTGAQAILFAGPGEETAEWLAALAERKRSKLAPLSPLLLGTNELDPAGFHPRDRARLEGAIFVGNDWEDRDPDLLARLARAGEGATSPDFRRGFRLGWLHSRSVLEGAWSASSLRLALEERSQRRLFGQAEWMISGIQQRAGTKPIEVVVPLFVVRNGSAVPLTSR